MRSQPRCVLGRKSGGGVWWRGGRGLGFYFHRGYGRGGRGVGFGIGGGGGGGGRALTPLCEVDDGPDLVDLVAVFSLLRGGRRPQDLHLRLPPLVVHENFEAVLPVSGNVKEGRSLGERKRLIVASVQSQNMKLTSP